MAAAAVPENSNRARTAWIASLSSALRTALACTIVGAVTLYGPATLSRHVAFPAFSYVTVVLVVTDATVGDTWRGCWFALYATVQSIGPAILSLWLIVPSRLSPATTSVVVAVAAAVVVLQDWTHILAKRIALGQIVLVYVIGFIHKEHTHPVMHPVHVAASTALGVGACVIALLLPFPRLATNEAKEKSTQYVENASERFKLYAKAFGAADTKSANSFISRAKCLANTGRKLIQSVKRFQESMQWERLPWMINSSSSSPSGEKLQEIEKQLRGMEIALLSSSSSSFPVHQELKDGLALLETQICLNMKNSNAVSAESKGYEKTTKHFNFNSLHSLPTSFQELPSIFFLFCVKLLHKPASSNNNQSTQENPEKPFSLQRYWKSKRIVPVLKCSISLGLATMLGLTYSRENGFWSGLPIAISLGAAREATFKVANVKVQGTVLGTVYGVLGCFLFERFLMVRFFSLLPWFIFSDFLRSSKMYGQAGGISAVIGAVLILGRKNFGAPSEFAIARIMETFIGLSCSVAVDVILNPIRASTLARGQVSKTLRALHDCLNLFGLGEGKYDLERTLMKVGNNLNGLSKNIGEAEVEPNFWFMPFNSSCYSKLYGSLSKMVDLLRFGGIALRNLEALKSSNWKEIAADLEDDLNLFKDLASTSIKCFDEVISVKSLVLLDRKLEFEGVKQDVELGRRSFGFDEDEVKNMVHSYLQRSQEVVDRIYNNAEGREYNESKGEVILCLSALGFCMGSLLKEIMQVEAMIGELVQWENPSRDVNLHEISCKVQALYSKVDEKM